MDEEKVISIETGTETKEEKAIADKIRWFRILGPSSLIYALLFAVCYHRNPAGIAIPVWIGSTIAYVSYVMKKLEVKKKKESVYYAAGMLLLGISTFLTGNPYIIFLNYVGFGLLLVTWLLHSFQEDCAWDFTRYFCEIGTTVLGAVTCIPEPLIEGGSFLHSKKASGNKNIRYVMGGLLLAVPAVFILGVLLSGADAVFGSWIQQIFGSVSLSETGIEMILLIVFGFFASYCGMRYIASKNKEYKEVQISQKNPIAAITFTMVITVLYLVFSMIQIVYLFLGYGALPQGMTYAVYARTGFFQLLFVSMINLILVLAVRKYICRHRLLDAILMTICGCTFIMIASSAYRMLLYIGAYQLTFLRVFVLMALAVIALIMCGVVITLRNAEFPLFRYSMVLVTVVYLCFSFSHVDYFIAKYNLSHMTTETKEETLSYLGTLSTDAAPVILSYLDQDTDLKARIQKAQNQIKQGHTSVLYSDDPVLIWFLWYQQNCQERIDRLGIRSFNLSYYVASRLSWY